MTQFKSVANPDAQLRNAYLNSLPYSQELYLELLVESGNSWCIADVAYAVRSASTLVEFFVSPDQSNRLVELFDDAMIASGATGVLCKSFDTQLLYAALSRPATVRPIGLLFRRIAEQTHRPRDDVRVRLANADDAPVIYSFNDDFFESLHEIHQFLATDGLFVLEKDAQVIGCGTGRRVIDNGKDIDIGMLIASEHRLNGYGAHMISFLKQHYLQQSLRPVCGCSIANTGSQRALRNAGFISEHRLIEISYQHE